MRNDNVDADDFIRCEGLVKIYKIEDVEVVALQGLDLTIQRGEVMGIIGPSGSGKTTLMNVLGGLDVPSAGKAVVDGIDLIRISDRQRLRYRRRSVGFVWQNVSRNLIPYLTAAENVQLPMILSGRFDHRRAERLLELVGLGHRLRHRPVTMSGGEQQRVAIAIGLANEPQVLLADEPTGSLDTENTIRLLEVFDTVRSELGVTVVIVTHDTSMARALDRYVQIRDGKTSTESVRRVAVTYTEQGTAEAVAALQAGAGSGAAADDAGDGQEEGAATAAADASHEHFTLLDSAGRLQIPDDMRDAYRIRGRVKLLEEDGRILIVPSEE
jgi:ABC-type lipoprotein export system ATPase subunit